MTVSIIEVATQTTITGTSPTIALSTTPVAGDVVVVAVNSSGARTVTGGSGLGATWSVAYNPTVATATTRASIGFLLGTGANASGTITVSVDQSRAGIMRAYLIRGLTSTTVAGVDDNITTTVTSLNGTRQSAGVGQIAIAVMGDAETSSGNAPTWPASSSSPSAGAWSSSGNLYNSFHRGIETHIPTGTGNVGTDMTLPVARAARITQLLVGTSSSPVSLTGVTANVTVAAPVGSVTTVTPTPVTLTGATGNVTVAAPVGVAVAGTKIARALTGVTANVAVSAPVGTVLAGFTGTPVALTGATASVAIAAPAGTVTSSSLPVIVEVVRVAGPSGTTLTVPFTETILAGDVVVVGYLGDRSGGALTQFDPSGLGGTWTTGSSGGMSLTEAYWAYSTDVTTTGDVTIDVDANHDPLLVGYLVRGTDSIVTLQGSTQLNWYRSTGAGEVLIAYAVTPNPTATIDILNYATEPSEAAWTEVTKYHGYADYQFAHAIPPSGDTYALDPNAGTGDIAWVGGFVVGLANIPASLTGAVANVTIAAPAGTVAALVTIPITPISASLSGGATLAADSVINITPVTASLAGGGVLRTTTPRVWAVDPRTGRCQYQFVVTHRDGSRYGELTDVTVDAVEEAVNERTETAFAISTRDPRRSLIQAVVRELQVWRGGHLIHKGPIMAGPETDGTSRHAVPDPRWYYEEGRVIKRIPRRNLLRNGDFTQGLAYWVGGYDADTIPALPPLTEIVDSDVSISGKAMQIIGADKSQLITQDVQTGAVFVPNSSTYLGGGEAIIENVGDDIPEGATVHIVGHTANNSINGDYGDGMALSLARANAAKATLLAQDATLTITTEGKGFYQPVATNATEAGQAQNRRVVIGYEGTQSALGSAQYRGQTLTYTQPTSEHRPLRMTFVGWYQVTDWIGPNLGEIGVKITASTPSIADVLESHSTFDADTPRDTPERATASIEIPANGLPYTINVRFYAPAGTIEWSNAELIPEDALSFWNVDQALIPKGILEFVQDADEGWSDLGIGTRTPLTGVKRKRVYAFHENMPAETAVNEFPALYKGMDIDLEVTHDTATLVTHYPTQGEPSEAALVEGREVMRWTPASTREVASLVVMQADGSGADRDEAYAWDDAALDGLRLVSMRYAENETPVSELYEAAVSELGKGKLTTPAYWVECHPRHTSNLLDTLRKGDTCRASLPTLGIDQLVRVVKRRLDPNTDALSYMIALEV